MKKIETTKNNKGVELDSFIYRSVKDHQDFYRCTNKNCNASVRIKDGNPVFKNEHSHNKNSVFKKTIRERIKKQAFTFKKTS
jgi:hypothetical protein